MAALRHILVATDFSPASANALESAVVLAQRFRAKLTVLHVLEPPPPLGPAPFPYPLPVTTESVASARPRLDFIVSHARTTWPDTEGSLRDGVPWKEIVSAAEPLKVDLIVVGSQGRRGLPRWILGSVAERVIRLSPVPVLTVHPYWFEDRTTAGRALAERLAGERPSVPAIIAVTPGALVVAAEIGSRLGTTPDLLLTRCLHDGHRVVGGMCEDGTIELDPEAPPIETRDGRLHDRSKLLAALRGDAMRLRGPRWIQDVRRRAVILVSDAVPEPWSVLAATGALKRMGAEHMSVAAPIASMHSKRALERVVDAVVFLRVVSSEEACATPYRETQLPPERELVACLNV